MSAAGNPDASYKPRPLEFQVLPALPGTRAFIFDSTDEGWLASVHGWLIVIDVVEHEDLMKLDLSCVRGKPLIVSPENDLQVAGSHGALTGHVVEVLEPEWDRPSDYAKHEHAAMVARYRATYGLAQGTGQDS